MNHDSVRTAGPAPGPAAGPAAVLAVDGGNSKADLVLVAADGALLAAVHGTTISHQAVGLEASMANLVRLASDATREGLRPRGGATTGATTGAASSHAASGAVSADGHIADLGVYGLAGADYPEDVRLLTRAIEARALTGETVVLNDTFAALRAGTHRPWGVVLICGQGINAAAVAPDGRTARFDGVGAYSGDWGGGGGIAQEGLAAAVRGRDGRGPHTALERTVPAHFGLASPPAVTKALYLERIPESAIPFLAPVIFRTAQDGDPVARSIIDRLADELAGMATALIRRLRLRRLDPEIVLAGGVFKTDDRPFFDRLEAAIRAVAPHAELRRLTAPPVLGAALIGLDRLSPAGAAPADAEARLRSALEAWAAR
ncbi:MAG: BadF/BadG/BcrA/BcrD ATPase family protein [Chloroflexota bacterium]